MKKSFVPISKQSKKAQKAYYSGQRSTWGILNPATRTMPNGKAYSRKKQKSKDRKTGRESFDSLSVLFPGCIGCLYSFYSFRTQICRYYFLPPKIRLNTA